MLAGPGLDVTNELRRWRPGPEQLSDALALELGDVLRGDDATAGEQNVLPSRLEQQLANAWEEGHVGAREDRQSHYVHVFLDRCLRDHLGCLMQAGVNDLHAGVPQRR